MVSSLLTAASYADIAFFVILALGLLGGLVGGLAKAFKGIFKSVAVILIALLLVGPTLAPVCKTALGETIHSTFTNMASGWGEVFNEPVHIASDGSYYIYVNRDGGKTKVKLEDAGESGLVGTAKSKFAVWLAPRFIKEDGQSLSTACADMLTNLIMSVILFVVYCIALGIICLLLRKMFKSLHSSDSPTVRTVDRILGAVVMTGLAIVFALFVLAILKTLSHVVPTMHQYLLDSSIVGFFYENNPIGKVLSGIFG